MPAHRIHAEVRYECGFECPRYLVPLLLPTAGPELLFPFVFDTGADISLFPLAWADHLQLRYDRSRLADARPITLAGPLTGHTGEFAARLRVGNVDVTFPLPCFFYHSPPVAPAGATRHRSASSPVAGLDDWQSHQAAARPGVPRPSGSPRGVLGRLGFLSRFRVFAQHDRFVVATDDASLLAELRGPARRRR